MRATADKTHWERIYTDKDPTEVSWYQATPERSLALIATLELDRDAPIIDVGGGASSLAARLLADGYSDVTVADISAAALEHAKGALGDRAAAVHWVEADVRDHDFGRTYEARHDRAVFHFMVDALDRDRYLQTLRRSVRPGGHVVIAGFGPEGPTRCSGLPVARYDGPELGDALGEGFHLVSAEPEVHITPGRATQQFVYSHLRRAGGVGTSTTPANVSELLAAARRRLRRLRPAAAHQAAQRGAILIDIRAESQRERDGEIPGARVVPRNVLEWRADPSCEHRDPDLARRDTTLILICDEGFQSSLAAATLVEFGLDATDVVGGAQAWIEAGLPVSRS